MLSEEELMLLMAAVFYIEGQEKSVPGGTAQALRRIYLKLTASPSPPTDTEPDLAKIVAAGVLFHRSLMGDWAAPRPESKETMKLSDAFSAAYMPHWPDIQYPEERKLRASAAPVDSVK